MSVSVAAGYAPEHALHLIRKGLFSEIPYNPTSVAAVLALIGKPWSLRELYRALETSDDQEKTADARAALWEIGSPEAEQAVLAWQEKNPHEADPGQSMEIDGRQAGPFSSMAEHMLSSRAESLRSEMDDLYERVMRVKQVVPPEPWD